MKNSQCPKCSSLNPPGNSFCTSCGSELLNTTAPIQTRSWLIALFARADSSATTNVLLPLRRTLALAVISWGLYLAFWLYITWKHLAAETDEAHYPLWHTLAILFVPIYGLFRFHKHIALIKNLAKTNNIDTTLEPLPAVIMFLLAGILQFQGLREDSAMPWLILTLFALILTTAPILWAQSPLNNYWYQSRAEATSPSLSGWEMVLVGIGIVSWVGLIIPVSS